METENNKSICFVLLPGFSPDNYPVQSLKEHLEKRGYPALTSNFYGLERVSDFSTLTTEQCKDNICHLVSEIKKEYAKVIGIGISLGGALLLDCAKENKYLDAIISIGTPFKIKHVGLINLGQKFLPIIKPFWKMFDLRKRRLPPIAATQMVMDYLCHDFPQNLDKISTPVLFLHSKKDRVTDYRVLDEFFEKVGSAKKEIIYFDNGGHVINGRTETALEMILNFLNAK